MIKRFHGVQLIFWALVGVSISGLHAADATATLSKTSLQFNMLAGQWPDTQKVDITFSVNGDNDSRFRVQPVPEWLQLLHGLAPPSGWILTQPYYIDVRPRGDRLTTAGEYRSKIILELSSGRTYEILVAVTVTNPPPPPVRPEITAVASSAYFTLYGLAPNSLVTIYGQRLSASVASAGNLPLPRKLNETEVLFCRRSGSGRACTPLELVFVSPTQINFLLKYSYIDGGAAGIVVSHNGVLDSTAASGAAALTVIPLNWLSPGIFAAGFDCPINSLGVPCQFSPGRIHAGQLLRATITDPDYRLITSINPATPSGTYIAWITGLGLDGQVGDLRAQLVSLRLRISLREQDLGSIADAPALFAGPSRDFPGLYQINFQIPPEIARASNVCTLGRVEIWFSLSGATGSPKAPIPIQVSPLDQVCR